MVELAKVTFDLDAKRGADVEWKVVVTSEWLEKGGTLEFELPRRLACAKCHGGGCDACERSGALVFEEQPLSIELPARTDKSSFVLRLPGYGGFDPAGEVTRGHLFLTIEVGVAPSERVVFTARKSERHLEREMLMKRSLLVAGLLIVTFVGLLRLSGWL